MRELNVNEIEDVNGGIIINPITVMIAVRVGGMAVKAAKSKQFRQAVGVAVGTVAGWFLTETEDEG